jgi:hypothetical protein
MANQRVITVPIHVSIFSYLDLYKRSMSAYFPTWKRLNEEREQSYLLTWR